MLIARLVAGLHCYLPERPDQVWAGLRQLGARRAQLTVTTSACRQQLRDLLECAWPAVLQAAAKPLDWLTWRAAVRVALAHTGAVGDPPPSAASARPATPAQSPASLPDGTESAAACGSCGRSGPPPPTPAGAPTRWPPSGPAPWNAPTSPWTTGTAPSASSPTPSRA